MIFDKIFKRKKSKEIEDDNNLDIKEQEAKDSSLAVVEEAPVKEEESSERVEGYHEKEFLDLATLLGCTVKEVKDDCLFIEIKKIMSTAGKVIVRYAPTKEELADILYNCQALGMGEILLAPSYMEEAKKIAKREGLKVKFSAIVDFPFGESSFKNKVMAVKDMASEGAESVSVMIPNMLLKTPQTKKDKRQALKRYKKEVVKYNKIYRERVGIALSVSDITEEQLKTALKTVEKVPLPFITAVFGEASLQEVLSSIKTLKKYKGNKKLKVLCNVEDEGALLELVNNGVDVVLSPYADQIGKNLVKRFKINGAKLK